MCFCKLPKELCVALVGAFLCRINEAFVRHPLLSTNPLSEVNQEAKILIFKLPQSIKLTPD